MDAFSDLVKAIFIPGSVAFLIVGLATGAALSWGPARARLWGRRWITTLAAAYWLMSLPIGADALVDIMGASLRPVSAADLPTGAGRRDRATGMWGRPRRANVAGRVPWTEGGRGAGFVAVREIERKANFKWLGFQRDVKALYAVSDLAVLPTYYREGGYPRALLEPMAMGKPVIATTSEHCRGAIEDGKNGYLVPVRDSNALAEAIEKVFSDEGKRLELGRYSLTKAVRDFDESTIVPEALRHLGLPIPKATQKAVSGDP